MTLFSFNSIIFINFIALYCHWQTRSYFRLKLKPTSICCPQQLISHKSLFSQNNCKEAMKIGEGQIKGVLLDIFVVKKYLLLCLLDAALSFKNNLCNQFVPNWYDQNYSLYILIYIYIYIYRNIHSTIRINYKPNKKTKHSFLDKIEFFRTDILSKAVILKKPMENLVIIAGTFWTW